MRRIKVTGWMTALALLAGAWGLRAEDTPVTAEGETSTVRAKTTTINRGDDHNPKFRDFAEVIKGSEKIDGLFTLHHKDEHLYAEIRPNQLDQPLLSPIAIARGMASAGQPLNFGDEWVILFKRVGDRVQLIRRNIHYKAASGSPLEKAVKQNYTDSILLALPIVSINSANGQAVVIDLSDIYFSNFAELPFGHLDKSRTNWHKIKGFPNNLEIEVEATFVGGGGRSRSGGDSGVADNRGNTIVVHYSLAKLPEHGYKARHADDRVGHFLSAVKDFALNDPDTSFVRQINRWRIEPSDPKAKHSPPKKQLIWYVENNVPVEYRPAVEAGILEWNKAFEAIGIRSALAVRWQEEGRDDFDPEDINYCTFRWITTSGTFAMSCLRANPLTGEMIDGDVIFDASWIKVWKEQYATLTGTLPPTGQGAPSPIATLGVAEIISPIMAAKQGYGLPFPLPNRGALNLDNLNAPRPELVPAEWNEWQRALQHRQASGVFSGCQYSVGMRPEIGLAAIALADVAKDKKDEKKEPEVKLPEEFLNQMIKEVVMHEVGHSLGLRHNFKASTMLTAEQLNDTAITHQKGMSGSVMDYNPINIAPKGQKQGDFTSTTLGPYDYWAIEYAYKHFESDEAGELKKIAARSPDADLVYGTDEDMYADNDPLVNTYDLGSDTLRFAKDRIALASDLLKDLDSRVVKDGESWSRLRGAFSVLLSQWGNGAFLAASHVGGQSVSRDHKGDKNAHDPIVPVKGAKQREALNFLAQNIFNDKAFKFSPALLRRLASERWYHWGNEGMSSAAVDYPVNERILGIQKIVLNECLSSSVLARLQNQELQSDEGNEPLRMAEVFRSLTDGVWSELPAQGDANAKALTLSTMRRNLQREHLRKLCTMVLGQRRNGLDEAYGYVIFTGGGGGSAPADARSLARLHLREIGTRVDKALNERDLALNDMTRAHLEDCRHKIGKVLDAGIDSIEP